MNSIIRKWGEQIIRSRQYAASAALLIAFFSFFNLPIGWLSTVIIALVTLQQGPKQGLIVGAWAILPAVSMLCLGQYAVFINIFLLHYLLVWSLAAVLHRKHAWAQVVQLAGVLGMAGVIAIYFCAPDLQSWLVSQLTTAIKEYKSITIFNFQPAEMDVWVGYIRFFALGLLAVATIFTNLLMLFLARWWQSIITSRVNIQKEYLCMRMHYTASLILFVLVLGLFINSALFINVLLVALVPFVLSGLSLLHAYAATKKNGHIGLFVFYMLFLFLSPYLMIVLSLMSCVDSFVNIRKRFRVDSAVIE